MVGIKYCLQKGYGCQVVVWSLGLRGFSAGSQSQVTSRCCLSFAHLLGFAMDGLCSIKGMHFASQVTVIGQSFKSEHGEGQEELLFSLLQEQTPGMPDPRVPRGKTPSTPAGYPAEL